MHIKYPDDIGSLTMEQWLDARVVDDTALEMEMRDALRNPWGILHGGVTAALVDACVEHATGGGIAADVVLHYLSPNRIGPVQARATRMGTRSDGEVVRVEVRDIGSDRVTALAVVTAADLSSG